MMVINHFMKSLANFKKRRSHFILFVSTREVGKPGYMSWREIKEIEEYEFVEIGNHSHTHEYLIDYTNEEIKEIFKNQLVFSKKSLEKTQNFFHIRLENIVKT